LQTLLNSTRPPQKTAESWFKKIKELRVLLHRIPFGEREAKIAVLFAFTVCWLLIVMVRSRAATDPGAAERSLLPALAAALQQGQISGRDFQSIYGPAAQILAWIATVATASRSALDAYGMITFFFCAASALLAAVMLLICDRMSWRECAIFYAFSILLNLFFDVFDIRTLLLLLNAVVAYRTIAAETVSRQIVWATASGLLCFVAQLVTPELGICASVAVLCALVVGSLLTQDAFVLLAIEVFVATFAAANVGLVALFRLTSSSYGLLFDYQNYSLELLRGYHNSMGMLWGLPAAKTLVLAIVTLYLIGVCAAAAWRSDPLEASLLASLVFAAVMWLKTALIHSDVPQILVAFTPMIVILSFLATVEWESPARRVAWAAAVCAALFIWPSLNFSAPADLAKVFRGETPVWGTIRGIYSTKRPLDKTLRANLNTSDFAEPQHVSTLAFPYDSYITLGLHRSFFAPVLESYAASTESLQRYYTGALDRQRRTGLEIIYGSDNARVPSVGGPQAITRMPIIFDYIYKYFELAGSENHADGHYILRPRRQPRDVAFDQLGFSVLHQLGDTGTLKLNNPSACGLVLLEIRIDYAKAPEIVRPNSIELTLSGSDKPVWRGSIMPLTPNQTFVTYVSPLPPERFHEVFGQDPVQSAKWDKIEYRAFPADMLGSAARLIQVNSIQCVDPKNFVEVRAER
jgi:hypothetical protein